MANYRKYGLPCNPFHPAGLPLEQDMVWAGRYELKQRLEAIIQRIIRGHRSECVVINGDYGSGKSHTLLYFHKGLNAGTYGKNLISVYIKNPGSGLMDFYRYLFAALGFSRAHDFARELLGITLSRHVRYGKPRLKYMDYAEILDRYTKLLSPEFLSSKISRLYSITPDFASAITFLGLDLHVEVAWKWLTGVKLGPVDMHKINVLDSLVSIERLEEAICCLIRLMHACGYELLFIMLDEVEDLLNIRDDATRAQYLRSIRRIIDHNPQGLGLFFACTEDGWREILLNYQPLASRLARGNFMQLFNLTFDETKQFIIDYLTLYRIDNPPSVQHPFNDGAINLIHEYSNGIPREIVKVCALSIERGFNKENSVISEDVVREALASG